MGDTRQQLAHGGQLLRLVSGFPLPYEFLFGLFALGDVAHNGAEKGAFVRLPTRQRKFQWKFTAVPFEPMQLDRFPAQRSLVRRRYVL